MIEKIKCHLCKKVNSVSRYSAVGRSNCRYCGIVLDKKEYKRLKEQALKLVK